MKSRLFTVVATLLVMVFGVSAVGLDLHASEPQAQIPPATEIQQTLTGLLPIFESFYGYDLPEDLNRAGLTLSDFSTQLYNYLNFLYQTDLLQFQEFDTYGDNWVFYFLDGIVMQMSQSPATHWGNVSLKGLVLNNIYVDALGLDFLDGFFGHDYIEFLVQNLETAAYFDFLMRDASIAAVLSFGAAARAYFERGETDGLAAIIGAENVTGLGPMTHAMRLDFLAGLLIDRMTAANLDDVIEYYADFLIIPSPVMVVPVSISHDADEQRRELHFFRDMAFDVTTDIDSDSDLYLFFENTGDADFIMTLQTYDAYGEWYILTSYTFAPGDYTFMILHQHPDLADFFRITVYSADGGIINGDFIIEI